MLGTDDSDWKRLCKEIVSCCHDVHVIMADLPAIGEDSREAMEALFVRVEAFATAYAAFIAAPGQDVEQARSLHREVSAIAIDAARLWQSAKG